MNIYGSETINPRILQMNKSPIQGAILTGALSLLLIFTGCQPKNQTPEGSSTADDQNVIEKYLDEKVMQPGFGGRIFSAHQIFTSETDKIYLWALLQEYYKKDGQTLTGTGCSVPMVLNIRRENGKMIILNHSTPGDGDRYAADIRKMFPAGIHQKIFDFPGSADMRSLEDRSKKRASAL
jgi:hypothetical protein